MTYYRRAERYDERERRSTWLPRILTRRQSQKPAREINRCYGCRRAIAGGRAHECAGELLQTPLGERGAIIGPPVRLPCECECKEES